MKYERGSFITVPSREKLRGMPPDAQVLYVWLCSYANETGKCFPSRSTLAKDCGFSEKTVDRMLVYLIEAGLLEKKHQKKGDEYASNLYTVLIGGSVIQSPPPRQPDARVASGSRTNSIHITETIESAEDCEDEPTLQERNSMRVIPTPYSIEATQEHWSNNHERRLKILNWYFRESGLWERATTRTRLQALMRRHNESAERIARAGWTSQELNDAKDRILANNGLEGEWTLDTVEKYATK